MSNAECLNSQVISIIDGLEGALKGEKTNLCSNLIARYRNQDKKTIQKLLHVAKLMAGKNIFIPPFSGICGFCVGVLGFERIRKSTGKLNLGQVDEIEELLWELLEEKKDSFPGSTGVRLYAEQLRNLATEKKKIFNRSISYSGRNTLVKNELFSAQKSKRNYSQSSYYSGSRYDIVNNPYLIERDPNSGEIPLNVLEGLSDRSSVKTYKTKSNDPKKKFFSLCLKMKMRLPSSHPGQKLSVELLFDVNFFKESQAMLEF